MDSIPLNAARKILLALSLIILPFLPASNLICYIGFVAAERTLYLSSVGYCILAGLLYDFCCPRLGRTLTVSLAFLALTLHGTRTYTRNMDWMDEESLYKSALELNPPKAYSNLGRVYAAQLRLNDAEAAYKMALEHRPNMADTWYNLGVLYQERKNLTSAVKCYETAVKLRKTFATAYLNLGIVHHENGDDQEAATIWEKCSRIDGSTVKAQREHQQAQTSCRLRLGKLLIQKKELQRARNILEEAAFQAALQTSPEHIPSLLTMGHLKNRQGDVAGAESAYINALELAGTHLESLRALATLLREQGRYDKSEQVLRTLQTHHPSSESYGDYGAILHLNGKLQKAKEFYEKSLQLDSKNNLVKENLRKLERKMASARLT
ncbi:tetratricopeptide repeat protein [Ancylostoma ceylanicum]|uniref:Tetratricopeptide repeat protein n=1 Tax=Ancylostoma ceylanicum TaxID=53326 RepID=A0A0D6LPP0_9BILA|nr:tetratricopeptide repeat protein [Ancylostoma ceylanicum]